MAYEFITLERKGNHDGIAWLELNRPEKLNALTFPLLEELYDALTTLRMDRTARVLVITGKGRGFCAGMDHAGAGRGQTDFWDRNPDPLVGSPAPQGHVDNEGGRLNFRYETKTFAELRRLDIPVIAGVNGACVGAGFDMACLADLAVASTNARYQVAYVKRGLYADLGGFWAISQDHRLAQGDGDDVHGALHERGGGARCGREQLPRAGRGFRAAAAGVRRRGGGGPRRSARRWAS